MAPGPMFQQYLALIATEHDREVSELRLELARLSDLRLELSPQTLAGEKQTRGPRTEPGGVIGKFLVDAKQKGTAEEHMLGPVDRGMAEASAGSASVPLPPGAVPVSPSTSEIELPDSPSALPASPSTSEKSVLPVPSSRSEVSQPWIDKSDRSQTSVLGGVRKSISRHRRSARVSSKFAHQLTTLLPGLKKLSNIFAGAEQEEIRAAETDRQKNALWRFVHCWQVKTACSAVIIINAIFIGLSTQELLRCEIHQRSSGEEWMIAENVFVTWFGVELIIRLVAERWLFLHGTEWQWNLLDAVLVFFSFLDLLSASGAPNFSVARLLRLFRFTRILRILRVLRCCQTFRVMVYAILHSLTSLVWVFTVLIFVKYCFAIFFLHGTTEYFRNLDQTNTTSDMLEQLFGTIPLALVTLFQAITGGRDWYEALDPLTAIHPIYGCFFILYIFFMVFGVLNVAIGAVVKTTTQIYNRDRQLIIGDEIYKLQAYTAQIKEFFHEADTDHSGSLSWQEFEAYLQDDKVKAYFQALELDVSQAHLLFALLDLDEGDSVSIDEFVDGCLRLKGQARSIDVNMLLYQVGHLLDRVLDFTGSMAQRFKQLEDHLGLHLQVVDEGKPKANILKRTVMAARSEAPNGGVLHDETVGAVATVDFN